MRSNRGDDLRGMNKRLKGRLLKVIQDKGVITKAVRRGEEVQSESSILRGYRKNELERIIFGDRRVISDRIHDRIDQLREKIVTDLIEIGGGRPFGRIIARLTSVKERLDYFEKQKRNVPNSKAERYVMLWQRLSFLEKLEDRYKVDSIIKSPDFYEKNKFHIFATYEVANIKSLLIRYKYLKDDRVSSASAIWSGDYPVPVKLYGKCWSGIVLNPSEVALSNAEHYAAGTFGMTRPLRRKLLRDILNIMVRWVT